MYIRIELIYTEASGKFEQRLRDAYTTPTQQSMAKGTCREVSRNWSPRFRLFVVSFWIAIFFNLQSFGQGLDFCFDGSKEGGF